MLCLNFRGEECKEKRGKQKEEEEEDGEKTLNRFEKAKVCKWRKDSRRRGVAEPYEDQEVRSKARGRTG